MHPHGHETNRSIGCLRPLLLSSRMRLSAQLGEIGRAPVRTHRHMRTPMFQRRLLVISIALVAVALSITPEAQSPLPDRPATFVPDWTFKGSALTVTEKIGQTTWRAENGEIVGTPTSPD